MSGELIKCTQPGCNRKYKLVKSLEAHLKSNHLFMDPIERIERVPSKRNKVKENQEVSSMRIETEKECKAILARIHDHLEGDDCVICMGAKRNAAVLPCGHFFFCVECLNEWNRQKKGRLSHVPRRDGKDSGNKILNKKK